MVNLSEIEVITKKKFNFKFVKENDEEINNKINNKIEKLKRIYSKLPETVCANRGYCCNSYKVIYVYSIESFYIKKGIIKNFSKNELKDLKERITGNILLEEEFLKRRKNLNEKFNIPCPFRDNENKICKIYHYRPYVCRSFGLKGVAKGDNCKNEHCKVSKCNNLKIVKKNKDWDCCKMEEDWQEIENLSDIYFYNSKKNKIFNATNIQEWLILLFHLM